MKNLLIAIVVFIIVGIGLLLVGQVVLIQRLESHDLRAITSMVWGIGSGILGAMAAQITYWKLQDKDDG